MIGRMGTALLVVLLALGCGSSTSGHDAGAGDTGGANDTAGSDDTGSPGDAGGLPGFGQACAPIAQQGDPQCAPGLVCVSVGTEQGRNLCTKTCTTENAPCTGGPSGTTPTCGRIFQVSPANSRVCEFLCDTSAPNCPPDTSCLADTAGRTSCQPPIQ